MEGFLFCEKAPEKGKKVSKTMDQSLEFKKKSNCLGQSYMQYNSWNYVFQNLMLESGNPNVEVRGRTYFPNLLFKRKGQLRTKLHFCGSYIIVPKIMMENSTKT
jgi:hypothetical protein